MKLNLRDRDRRALLGLGLALGIYLAASKGVLPVYDRLKSSAESVSGKEDELRKYRRALSSKEHYTQLLDQAKRSVSEGAAHLVRGDNPTVASLELQTIVEEAAKKVNISLGQRNMSDAKKKDTYFNEISMSLSFDSTLNQLTSFLTEIRSSPKFVTVRTLQIAPVQPAEEAPAKGDLKKTVRVNLAVSALLPAPAVAPKAKS